MSKNIFATLVLSVLCSTSFADMTTMCAQVIIPMMNPQTKEVKMARNSCEAADLRLVGFVESSMNEVVATEPAQPVLTVIKSGSYKIANVPADYCNARINMCPPTYHVVIAQSQLILSLPLVGCVDSAFVTYKISDDAATGVKTVLVSAINVGNEKSKVTRCFAAPFATKSIDLHASVMDKSLLKVEFVQEIAK
jgi:hypothetical protein